MFVSQRAAKERCLNKEKGIQDNYLYNTFKSANGDSKFHDPLKDFWIEEKPEDYSYTESYFD